MSKPTGILGVALQKLASGELQREAELERQERAFDDLVWRMFTTDPLIRWFQVARLTEIIFNKQRTKTSWQRNLIPPPRF